MQCATRVRPRPGLADESRKSLHKVSFARRSGLQRSKKNRAAPGFFENKVYCACFGGALTGGFAGAFAGAADFFSGGGGVPKIMVTKRSCSAGCDEY